MSGEFREKLLQGYQDGRWRRIIEMVETNDELGDNAAKLPYKLVAAGHSGKTFCMETADGYVGAPQHDLWTPRTQE